MYAFAQVAAVARSARSCAPGHAEPLVGQRDLGRAPEHVALPLGAGVVVVRVGGHQLPDVGRLGVGEDRAGQLEVVAGGGAAGELGAEREVGRVPPGQVGADLLPGRGRLEHRPVLDVVGGRAGVAALGHVEEVLLLGQEPEVVVALDRVRGVAVADPDLHVEDLLARVPELGDPLQAELRLRLERRVFLAGVVARRDQHQRVGVAGGVAELLVAAAGVEPAAGHVDRAGRPS